MRKKVAVFSTSWNADYLYQLLSGIRTKAKEDNADLFIFNTYGDLEQYKDFNRCEYNIFRLAKLEDFNGALIVSNSVGSAPWVGELRERILAKGIPCIGVEQDIEGIHYMGTDNYSAMYEIVNHLVLVHHCRIFNYVGGPYDNIENISRKKAFMDALNSHGIAYDGKRVRDYSFRRQDGVQAFEDFKKLGLHKTDAVVFANDNMALGYLSAAINAGLRVPEDFLVTGFDNLSAAATFSPRVTSVDRARNELGYKSMEQLLGLMEGKEYPKYVFTPHSAIYSESCGCSDSENRSIEEFRRGIYETECDNEDFQIELNHFRLSLLENQGMEGFYQNLIDYTPAFGIDKFCCCTNSDEFSYDFELEESRLVKGYPEKMDVFGVYEGVRIPKGELETAGLLPAEFIPEDGKSHTYFFSPNHCSGRNLGYCMIMDNLHIVKKQRLYNWITIVNIAMEGLRQNIKLIKMNEKMKELYRKDSVTGVYNRFALTEKGELLFQENCLAKKKTLVMFIDMDYLKNTNDIYGHEMGDAALKTLAESIKNTLPQESYFCVRYGGDEFLILGTCEDEDNAEELKKSIHHNISKLTAARHLPFKISVSIGYTYVLPGEYQSLEYHIKAADEDMYTEKKRKLHV
ncbi:MAG: GGDEF domain-containing protein [Bacillota bacterium]|nr:GGDEF domain-containing protein [Bacillota bacterium]